MNLEDEFLHVLGDRLAKDGRVGAKNLANARKLRGLFCHGATAGAAHQHIDIAADLGRRHHGTQRRCTTTQRTHMLVVSASVLFRAKGFEMIGRIGLRASFLGAECSWV